MASGKKSVIINTQERAVSTDINRLQGFAGAADAEFQRYLLNVGVGLDDIDASAVTTENLTLGTPLLAEIANGFLVRPGIGSLAIAIDPGVLWGVSPDSDPDASVYKYVKDPGLVSGILNMTSNASGSTRIDVIECQIGNITSETSNRDIFNPTTGLFSATSVPKAQQDSLTYRVRLGTPGAGFPGTVSGWLPLCVASVPTATTINDTITFWDVRPLLNDREFQPFNTGSSVARVKRCLFNSVPAASAIVTDLTCQGIIEASYKGRRVGGRLRRGTPGTDNANIVFGPTTLDNVAIGTVFSAGLPFFGYLSFPFSLPRWARYTDASSGSRVPRSPRGIFTVSHIPPNQDGTPIGGLLNFPASCGFVAQNSTSAVCVFVAIADGATTAGNVFGDGSSIMSASGVSCSLSSQTTSSAKFTCTTGTAGFSNAKKVLVTFFATLGSSAAFTYSRQINVYAHGNTTDIMYSFNFGAGAAPAGTIGEAISCWIPIPTQYPVQAPADTFQIEFSYGIAGGTPTATGALAVATGWEFL